MVAKFEADAEADATKKAYCDNELVETNQKKSDKTAVIEKLAAKIASSSANSAKLKERLPPSRRSLQSSSANRLKWTRSVLKRRGPRSQQCRDGEGPERY